MQNISDKVKTILGFAIKAGKVIFGTDNIATSRRKKYLTVVCRTIAKKNIDRIVAACPGTPVITTVNFDLGQIVHKDNCKAVAIVDQQMANAIMNSYNNDMYHLISEGK